MRHGWIAVTVLTVGLLSAPATATVPTHSPAAKQVGTSLRIVVKGLPKTQKARIRIKGPGGFTKTVRTTKRKVLKGLKPGTYRIVAKPTSTFRPVTKRKTVRVTRAGSAVARFRYEAIVVQQQTPPAPPGVTGLTLAKRTAFSLALSWTNPASPDVDRVIVRRVPGTDPPASANNGAAVTLPDPTTETVTDSDVTPTSDFTYAVYVRYRDGRTSDASTISGRTLAIGAISSDSGRTCAIDWTGKAWCFGAPPLGDGSSNGSQRPVAVDTSGVLAGRVLVDVAAGNGFTCVRDEQGKLFCWGANGTGQLGTGDTTDSVLPRSIETSGALQGKQLVAVTAGVSHACAVDADGTAYCWGGNAYGQLGNGTLVDTALPTPVSAGAASGERFIGIGSGAYSVCAVAASGRAYCWGYNAQGQLGNGTKVNSSVPVAVSTATVLANKRLLEVSAGQYHSCGVDSDGLAYCWGSNGSGRLGDGTGVDSTTPVAVSTSGALSGRNVTDIAADVQNTCTADSAGRVACWGYNGNQQIGDGTNVARLAPTAVITSGALGPEKIIGVSVDTFRSCALAESGHAFCWGAGPLGDGTANQSGAPVQVVGFGR